jgi:phenylacetate-CoA ligase
MDDFIPLIRSAVPGIAWPAVPGQEAAQMLALQFQLERSQWLAPEQLQELQFRQLDTLLRHAHATTPYYRKRWGSLYDPQLPLTQESFSRIPLLTRGELQAGFESLKSTGTPGGHGRTAESRTSGATGQPVRVLKTELVELLWRAVVLREHQWFRRDLGGKLAAIRQGVPEIETDGWGPATDAVAVTGRSVALPISVDVDSQLKWLERQQPDYLLTYASNLAELARTSIARGVKLPRLREARAMGEALADGTRDLVRQAWGVRVTDSYSSNEVGHIALQCPEHEHYHVQSEMLLVEVLDEAGRACRPGQAGRVVVTDLHNFAMPLVRYELGDYAEPGMPCSCGRGLPVLTRINGRVRNMLITADGKRYWPTFGSAGLAGLAPVMRQQLVQTSLETIEVRLVTACPLTPEDEARLRGHILSKLPVPFEIRFSYHDNLARSSGGKFEDFVSEVAAVN